MKEYNTKTNNMRTFLSFIFLLFFFNSFSQLSDFKVLIGRTETEVSKTVDNFSRTKESFDERGKQLFYYFSNYTVVYVFKSDKICNQIFLMFNSADNAAEMNKWFYENGYKAEPNNRTGKTENWVTNLKIKSENKNAKEQVRIVEVYKINNTSYQFADFMSKLNLPN